MAENRLTRAESITDMQSRHPVTGISVFYILMILSGCTDSGPKVPEEGVHADGSPVNAGSGLSAGLDEDPFSEPTEENDHLQQETSDITGESTSTKYKVLVMRLNTRSGPGKSFKALGVLKKGQVVHVISLHESGWAKLEDGRYCSTKHLKKISAENQEARGDR